MAVDVKMPQLGESVHEGTIGKWLKAEGDSVEKYEPLLEVITDKVDTEVTASHAGTLIEILAAEGDVVNVGSVIARIGDAGEVGARSSATGAEGDSAAGGEGDGEPAARRTGDGESGHGAADGTDGSADASAGGGETGRAAAVLGAATGHGAAETNGVTGPAGGTGAGAGGVRVSPVAARVASEHGIDPGTVEGTGPGGQVKRQDVERHIAQRDTGEGGSGTTMGAPATSAPSGVDVGFISPRVARLAAQHGVDLRSVEGSGRDGRITARDVERFVATAQETATASAEPTESPAARSAPAAAAAGTAVATVKRAELSRAELVDEVVALTPMRRAIAEHMVHSKRTAPHVTTVHEVDMSAAMAALRSQRQAFADRGVRLTLTAIIVDAVARALSEHPFANSSWTDDGIKLHRSINIGMAVAIAEGLIVPVIRNADEKSLIGIARDVTDLAERARTKRLSPDDVQGGTFTITNYGTLGGLFGTPVISQPQCAILGTGAVKKRVVVVEGTEGDTIAIRPMMFLSLTFDHRIMDGGMADPFVQTIVRTLETYEA